jgi:hypothetical protein
VFVLKATSSTGGLPPSTPMTSTRGSLPRSHRSPTFVPTEDHVSQGV